MAIQIIMDERERGEIRQQMKSLPVDLKIHTLDVGDYILSPRTVVERKRGDDFVASIFDQRLFLQLEKLKISYPHPILILENPKRMFERKFINTKATFGALVYVSTRLGIPIIPTSGIEQTASILFEIARSEQEQLHEQKQQAQEQKQTQQYEQNQNEDWIHQTAATVGISRGDQTYFLQGLIDVGSQRAEQLLDMFQTPANILYAFDLTDIVRTKFGNPKGISGVLAEVSGIGPKIVDRNQNLLHFSYKQAKKEKKRVKVN
ncbi:MAG: hypothetical protein DRO88_00020 [Promethearchaeia archaeon]|nr:MAG: hypothetical protein DRO88_00020 [Candidatus Lokiarchaeia archaeon]